MNAPLEFQNLLRSDRPILALAPMQDVTDRPFMRLISGYGNADVYFTEYFRVLPDSRLDPKILASITQNPRALRSCEHARHPGVSPDQQHEEVYELHRPRR